MRISDWSSDVCSSDLVGILAGAAGGIRDADPGEEVDGLGHGGGAPGAAMDADRLRDLVADRIDGVQARHRLLEDHGDVVATNSPKRLVVERGEIADRAVLAAKEIGRAHV